MKKTIALCLFVLATFLGTQSVVAQETALQNTKEINAKASEKTEALRKFIKFDNTKRDQVYEAYKTYNQAKASLKRDKITDKKAVEKVEKQLNDQIKGILNEEQFERYKLFLEQN